MFASIAANASAAVHAKVRDARAERADDANDADATRARDARTTRWGFDANARWGWRRARASCARDARGGAVEDNFYARARARGGMVARAASPCRRDAVG